MSDNQYGLTLKTLSVCKSTCWNPAIYRENYVLNYVFCPRWWGPR